MTYNHSQEVYQDKYFTNSIVTAISLTAISTIAIGGNFLVLVSIGINRNLRSSSDLLLANLAVADLGQALLAIPFRVIEFLRADEHVTFLIPCHIVALIAILFGGASNINILLVSIDKFVAIMSPFKYNTRATEKIFIASVVMSWAWLLVFAVLPLVGWGRAEYNVSSPTCRFTTTFSGDYLITSFILIHGIPLTTTIILYLFILKAALRHSRAIAAQEFCLRTNDARVNHRSLADEDTLTNSEQHAYYENRNLPKRMRSRRPTRGARMIAVLVGVFILLNLPIVMIDLVEIWNGPTVPSAVVSVAVCLICANSAINFLIYGGWNREYKRTFRIIFACLWNFVKRPFSASRT
ncbi:alpha-1B adrenergic receptor-like [Montipora capricornis]|uniref:alpha-1B adrenergic receptor-like n=1 Tax=Montipora capricornis TaxID=246305 RepID=UPI0035F20BAD